ncbi:hypothetical protein ABDC18_002846 [Escherichia coli]
MTKENFKPKSYDELLEKLFASDPAFKAYYESDQDNDECVGEVVPVLGVDNNGDVIYGEAIKL